MFIFTSTNSVHLEQCNHDNYFFVGLCRDIGEKHYSWNRNFPRRPYVSGYDEQEGKPRSVHLIRVKSSKIWFLPFSFLCPFST